MSESEARKLLKRVIEDSNDRYLTHAPGGLDPSVDAEIKAFLATPPKSGLPCGHLILGPGCDICRAFAVAIPREDRARALALLWEIQDEEDDRPFFCKGVLLCQHCHEQPAACVGRYEGHGPIELACDTCCGHGCEDGWCVRLADATARSEASAPGEDRLGMPVIDLPEKAAPGAPKGLVAQVRDLKDELAALRAQLEGAVEDARSRADAMEDERDAARSKSTRLSGELANIRAERDALTAELAAALFDTIKNLSRGPQDVGSVAVATVGAESARAALTGAVKLEGEGEVDPKACAWCGLRVKLGDAHIPIAEGRCGEWPPVASGAVEGEVERLRELLRRALPLVRGEHLADDIERALTTTRTGGAE